MGGGQGALAGVGLISPEFWREKKVFVTGHTGFKGGWLALWLSGLGARVKGYSLPPDTTPNLFDAIGLEELITEHVTADVRDLDTLDKEMQSFAPEIIFHLAAQPLVRVSYQLPVDTCATNIMGTVNLLEATRRCSSVQVVVNITTDKVYENHEWHWGYRENDRLAGHDPYSASKACSELMTACFRQSFLVDCGVATARAGNVIGGGDWCKDRLVPDAVQAFVKGNAVNIRNPHSTRPWQHVLEPLRGYLLLAQACHAQPLQFSEAFNFGPRPESTVTVSQLMEEFVQAWGEQASWIDTSDGPQGPVETNTLSLDISKATSLLGWAPTLSLKQAVQSTVLWYQAHGGGANAEMLRALMRQQLAQGVE